MSKKIESPIKRWPGFVTIADPMTWPQVEAFENALKESGEFFEDKDGNRVLKAKLTWSGPDRVRIDGIVPCVEKFELENFPDEIPATPRTDSHALVTWLFSEIFKVYLGEVEIPNE